MNACFANVFGDLCLWFPGSRPRVAGPCGPSRGSPAPRNDIVFGFPDSSPPALPTPQGHETRCHPLSRRKPGPTCATHGTELGGESPLRAARSGTDSQRQLRRSDAGWGGSRRQIGGPTNRHRIQGQCGGATRRGTGAPDTPSVHRKGRSGGCPEKVQCITVGDLPSSPGEPEQGVGDGVRWPGRGQPRP